MIQLQAECEQYRSHRRADLGAELINRLNVVNGLVDTEHFQVVSTHEALEHLKDIIADMPYSTDSDEMDSDDGSDDSGTSNGSKQRRNSASSYEAAVPRLRRALIPGHQGSNFVYRSNMLFSVPVRFGASDRD